MKKKKSEWMWTGNAENDFSEVKKTITKLSCIAQIARGRGNTISIDTSGTRFGLRNYLKEDDKKTKHSLFRIKIWTTPSHSVWEFEHLVVVCAMKQNSILFLRWTVHLQTGSQALER